ncbi:MAG TPA: DUF4242 domain-containing protein [Acidobacteriota bacterium]|nr:DUF4242 domain-containing protein [Acidobacteriota bacterium]
MPKYVIERDIPKVGDMTGEELRGASQTSCEVLRLLGPDIEWDHSYVTPDKIYCIYRGPNTDIIKKHAAEAGLPANKISELKAVINPATAY